MTPRSRETKQTIHSNVIATQTIRCKKVSTTMEENTGESRERQTIDVDRFYSGDSLGNRNET